MLPWRTTVGADSGDSAGAGAGEATRTTPAVTAAMVHAAVDRSI
ncbi:hypothetical protein K701_16160 [Streptomyces fradiae ATCC 10745 = DSM 40063]|uniref:Uncharacterized protein n=1 Tax=Streptomyces fradiae ATCC 10745 = DSM 40063 TaxID=1319510 RepID=A0ABQ6XTG4_STRFR|nr:hypothetical protein K701_16160 [Streptomyces fradiae ATCC 10745 = DSM 40063]